MRFLLIGGTRFVGRHVAESALERGHEVTVFHRGQTGKDDLPGATHLLGDRDSDLDRLSDGAWDVTVESKDMRLRPPFGGGDIMRLLVVSLALASVAMMRAPVAAKGWPIASEPPLTLSFERSIDPSGASSPSRSRQNAGDSQAFSVHSTCAAKASWIS